MRSISSLWGVVDRHVSPYVLNTSLDQGRIGQSEVGETRAHPTGASPARSTTTPMRGVQDINKKALTGQNGLNADWVRHPSWPRKPRVLTPTGIVPTLVARSSSGARATLCRPRV